MQYGLWAMHLNEHHFTCLHGMSRLALIESFFFIFDFSGEVWICFLFSKMNQNLLFHAVIHWFTMPNFDPFPISGSAMSQTFIEVTHVSSYLISWDHTQPIKESGLCNVIFKLTIVSICNITLLASSKLGLTPLANIAALSIYMVK